MVIADTDERSVWDEKAAMEPANIVKSQRLAIVLTHPIRAVTARSAQQKTYGR